jgi:hypothetical protein
MTGVFINGTVEDIQFKSSVNNNTIIAFLKVNGEINVSINGLKQLLSPSFFLSHSVHNQFRQPARRNSHQVNNTVIHCLSLSDIRLS